MDDETSTSSSGPGIPTPRSSTASSPPQPNLLLPPPEGTTDLRTLESARESVAWLAGQIVYGIERVLHARAAGTRARACDTWVINEAGRLMARLVPHMEGTSGAFSLDGGQLLFPPYPDWPTRRPAGGDGETDPSAKARGRMEEFSSAVRKQLESAGREQRRRLRSSLDDFEDEVFKSLVPRKKQKQQTQWHRPLVVNGSTPYQKATEAATSASTGGTQTPVQQHYLQEQQKLPIYDAFGLWSPEYQHTAARPSSRATSPPMATTSGPPSPSSTSASPSHSTTHTPRTVAPTNIPTTRALPPPRWTPPPLQAAMSPPPNLHEFVLRPRPQPTQPPVPAPRVQSPPPPAPSSSFSYRPRSPLFSQSREGNARLALQYEPHIGYFPGQTMQGSHYAAAAAHHRGPPPAPRDTRDPFYGYDEPAMLPLYGFGPYDDWETAVPYGSFSNPFYDSPR